MKILYTTSTSDIVYTFSGIEKTNAQMAQLYSVLNDNLVDVAKKANIDTKDLMTWKQGISNVTKSQDSGDLTAVFTKKYYCENDANGGVIKIL